MPASIHVSEHPLVQHRIAVLRHKDTPCVHFRALVQEIAQFLFYEASRDFRLRTITVPTPLAEATGQMLAERIGLVPVLRAGLGMAQALLSAMPEATVWHLGLYRDHETLQPITYYNKIPQNPGLDVALVLDPMLATGGSAVAACNILKAAQVPRLKYIGLIAAPEGIAAMQAAHPDVPLYLGEIDSHLNEIGYIVPGLGDAGDRQFGT
ncbi:MAG: uracil phosphoribosyltransferase [Bacteroidales bacterium]|nr:uracil phosphoribosyltransferase [Bacteroidales bacterium]